VGAIWSREERSGGRAISQDSRMLERRDLEVSSLDGATSVFLSSRSRLFDLAYRMLGTTAGVAPAGWGI
jgi:hypothetical protein